ncbi:hypothetical protein CAEBREN_23608 [Caenorhabditis brenneri]|uniref:Uncharacterized protein n=1 Tax=Caenorhabditis brenneri TaxID=135651 RepID=G0N6T1_CAEBE|nr:hypothetical protein CAEBREN_23608 [Caenorhabditis brenneri]
MSITKLEISRFAGLVKNSVPTKMRYPV